MVLGSTLNLSGSKKLSSRSDTKTPPKGVFLNDAQRATIIAQGKVPLEDPTQGGDPNRQIRTRGEENKEGLRKARTKEEVEADRARAKAEGRPFDEGLDFGKVQSDEPGVFRNEKGRTSGVSIGDRNFLGLGPKDVESILRARQERLATPAGALDIATANQDRRRIEALSGVLDPVISDIESRQLNPPSLAPEPLIDQIPGIKGATAGLIAPTATDALDGTKLGDFIETTEGLSGLAAGGVGVLGLVSVTKRVAPKVIQKVASIRLGKMSGTATLLWSGVLSGLGVLGFGKVADFNRGKIESRMGKVSQIASEVSALAGASEAGGSEAVATGIKQLVRYEEELQDIEEAIKTMGIYNFRFRTDQEYIEFEAEIRSARTDILEQIRRLSNLAIQGQKEVDPERLILNVEDLDLNQ